RFFCMAFIFLSYGSCMDKAPTREEKISIIKQLYYDDQKYQRILAMLEEYECIPDSVSLPIALDKKTQLAKKIIFKEILKPSDKKNTKRLIDFTKKYGFPGMDYLDHDVPIYLVFVHAEKEDRKKIMSL